MSAEGWYVDPFRLHEARWISDGTPTSLVRDGDLESKDPPTDASFSGPYEELPESAADDASDLQRADSAEVPSQGPDGDSIWGAFTETSGGD